jgi:nitrogen PTS system EIIA component
MYGLENLIDPKHLILDLKASNKRELLSILAQTVEEQIFYKKQIVLDALLEREKLGSTGIGHGIALPHIRLVGLHQMLGFFCRLETPIDFDAVDNKPVDLCFMLLAPVTPSYRQSQHVQALANIARSLRDTSICRKIRTATETKAAWHALTQTPETKIVAA